MPPDAQAIDADLREELLVPFVTGLETALRELAGTEAVLRFVYRLPVRRLHGDLVVLLDLTSSLQCGLALGVGTATAAALAQRMLTDAAPKPDEALIRDSIGEIANVASGQAKALLHGTPYQFTFGTPRLAEDAQEPAGPEESLVAVMATDVGDVVVQLFVGS
jgi:CheY-specific phosphatase CheX